MNPLRVLAPAVLLLLVPASAVSGQEPATTEDPTIAVLLSDLSMLEQKLLALADAFTEEQYGWHPAEDVRSVAEVFMHLATTNFGFPMMAGHEAPASTGMTMENLMSAAPAYEMSLTSKEDIRPEFEASLEHLHTVIASTSASDLERQIEVFGTPGTVRRLWMAQVNHLHEHLGQLIAYGRMNGVVPPWNQ